MRFLDFIEKQHRVRFPADCLCQLTTFIVPNITGRRSDQTGDGEFFLVFRHVDSGHHILVIEEIFRQCLGQFRLANARRTQEDEGSDRPFLILQSGPRPSHRIRNRSYGFVLTDHSLVQFFFQVNQLLPFALQHPGYRDTRPSGNN